VEWARPGSLTSPQIPQIAAPRDPLAGKASLDSLGTGVLACVSQFQRPSPFAAQNASETNRLGFQAFQCPQKITDAAKSRCRGFFKCIFRLCSSSKRAIITFRVIKLFFLLTVL
jgi:hypothetical protein